MFELRVVQPLQEGQQIWGKPIMIWYWKNLNSGISKQETDSYFQKMEAYKNKKKETGKQQPTSELDFSHGAAPDQNISWCKQMSMNVWNSIGQ